MIVIISGQAVDLPLGGSIKISDKVFERSTASFDIVTNEDVRFLKGQNVVIYDDNGVTIKFEGYIESSTEVWIGDRVGIGANLKHSVNCIDQHYLADKRIVARAYVNQYAGSIVKDIVDGFLGNEPILGNYIVSGVQKGEGVTIGHVEDGPVMYQVVFNYVPASQAIEALAEQCGFWWMIRPNKSLWFGSRTADVSSLIVESQDAINVNVTDSNSRYRNRQYIRGGRDITDPQTEIQVGDGQKSAFTMAFPVAEEPTIAVSIAGGAYVGKTVGIGGVDTGKQWYWNKSEYPVFQDPSIAKLTTADKVRVIYRGEFDIIILSFDQAEIEGRKAIEDDDTSGFVDEITDDMNIKGRDAAFQLAGGLLANYSVTGRTVTFETYVEGIKPGQLITINFPEHNLDSNQFLVESVEMSDY